MEGVFLMYGYKECNLSEEMKFRFKLNRYQLELVAVIFSSIEAAS